MRAHAAPRVPAERPAYLPRGKQRPFLYCFDQEMFWLYVLEWHRRYGKGRAFMNAGGAKARDEGWWVWHTFPTFTQGRTAMWAATDPTGRRILEDLLPFTTETGVNDMAMRLTFPSGGIYQIVGTDKINKRIGSGPNCIGHDEFSLQNPMARNYYAPMLKENQGPEVLLFTPRGENHATGAVDYALAYPGDAFYSRLTVDDTVRDAPGEPRWGQRVIGPADIERERQLFASSGGKLGMSESMIQQEFYLSREGVNQNQVYGEELAALRKRGGITAVPHDPGLLVHTFWDRGVHNRVGFVQFKGRARFWIDYLSTDNSSPMQIAAMLKEDMPDGPQRSRYHYGEHWVGRDAEDPTAWQWHEKSSLEIWAGLGIRFKIAPFLLVTTGINAVKAVLGRCYFDAKHCGPLLNDLREYRWAVDPVYATLKEPDKRQISRHAADMVRVMATSEHDELTGGGDGPPEPGSVAAGRFAG